MSTDSRELTERELYENAGLGHEFNAKYGQPLSAREYMPLSAREYMEFLNPGGVPMSEETEIELRIRLQREMVKAAIKEGLRELDIKVIVKEGIREWLDSKVLTFGWAALATIVGGALILFAWGLLTARPWEMKIK